MFAIGILGIGIFLVGISVMGLKDGKIQVVGVFAAIVGMLIITQALIADVEPDIIEWQQFQAERNSTCNECLIDHGWNVTVGDYQNMSPFMIECCPECQKGWLTG